LENSKIEWTDHTFNPWIGCQRVSPGCTHCYAEALATRYGLAKWGVKAVRKRTSPAYWRKPLSWNRRAEREGVRRRVFCASMADVFDPKAPAGAREDLWDLIRQTPNLDWQILTKRPDLIRQTPNLDWQILTKRPERIRGNGKPGTCMLPADWGAGYPNVWLGVTIEDAMHWAKRWMTFSNVPARIRFVSYEPALGPICMSCGHNGILPDWVIFGGESGPGARPTDAQWARAIRDQCASTGIAFFLKQWGTWASCPDPDADTAANGKGGALLDGVLHREFPSM